MTNKGKISKQKGYEVEVKYSPEAVKNKLVRFTVTEGKSFVISADELIALLSTEVNSDMLSPTFVETDRINVVEVGRQLECVLDRDFKKGEKIRIGYIHPLPVEYAIIEEAFKMAQIKKDTKVFELTKEYLDAVSKKITPDMRTFTEKLQKSFKNIKK